MDGYVTDVLPVIDGTHNDFSESTNPTDDSSYDPSLTQFENFQQVVENFEVPNQEGMDCGYEISEEKTTNAAGEEYYRTVIKNTCETYDLFVRVYMDEEEWNNVAHFYSRSDDTGNLVKDSIVYGSSKYDSKGYLGIEFKVGYITYPENYGVSEHLQGAAGWENMPGDWGVRYYTVSWKSNGRTPSTPDKMVISLELKSGAGNYANCDGIYAEMDEPYKGNKAFYSESKNRIILYDNGLYILTSYYYWPNILANQNCGGGFHFANWGETDITKTTWNDYSVSAL